MKIPRNEVPKNIWRNPIHFVACVFGIGAVPYAPGTFATLASIPLYLVLSRLPVWLYLLIVIVLIALAIVLCEITNRDFGTDDHPAVAIDEFVTFPIVMIGLPCTWYFILMGFVLFRLFDIWKPGPIGWLDKNLHGGFGVVLDDVAAALLAWIVLLLIKVIFF